jgi:UDP-GlcNAc:undecaprenyl-phosphate/decaprenyl-phosphate GlcNAc-1-phosphate transferase
VNLLLICFLCSTAATLALVPLCRIAAFRFDLVARPKEDRWHRKPTAMLGGVAIALPPLIGALLVAPVSALWLPVVCCGLMFIVGLTDDVVPLKPATKLIAEIGLASILLAFGYRLQWVDSLTLDAMLTMVWLVGITNALNLLDNMDGLCAGIAAVAAASLLAGIYPEAGATPTTLFLAMLLGSTIGFLVYNFNPASIFMGDSGSLFLGLALATIALQLPHESSARSNMLSVMAAPLLVLLIPIFDTTLVTLSRLFSGRRPSQGGRDHSSHRLVAIGLPERTAVLVLWTLAALGGTVGLTLHDPRSDSTLVPAALFVLAMIVFAAYLARVRVYENQESVLQNGRITPFVVNIMYKRRVLEVLLDVCLVVLAYYSAYRLRFEGAEYSEFFPSFIQSLPLVLGTQMVVFFVVGVYRGVWRYFGLMDGVILAKGVIAGTVLQVFLILYFYRFEHYSRGVFIIYAGTLVLFLAGSRASFRLISEFARRRRPGQRLVVYGAGDGGLLVVRELLNDSRVSYRMLGYIDDDPNKRRVRVQGYPVLGGYESLVSLVSGGAVDTVVVSTRLIAVDRLRELEQLCATHNVNLSRLHFRLEEMVAVS